MSDKIAVVAAAHTMRTLVDGSVAVTLHIDPRDAKQAFELFGVPGTPVAIAKLTNQAAVEDMRRQEPEANKDDYGDVYKTLYSRGWFNNPSVCAAFGVMFTDENGRDNAIKSIIYNKLQVKSLTEIPPSKFADMCKQLGIEKTLPKNIQE